VAYRAFASVYRQSRQSTDFVATLKGLSLAKRQASGRWQVPTSLGGRGALIAQAELWSGARGLCMIDGSCVLSAAGHKLLVLPKATAIPSHERDPVEIMHRGIWISPTNQRQIWTLTSRKSSNADTSQPAVPVTLRAPASRSSEFRLLLSKSTTTLQAGDVVERHGIGNGAQGGQ